MLGVPGLARTDERRFALGVLNAALGGGMSSRLFQEVREKRGLAYSVYSFSAQYADSGFLGIYAGCSPKKVKDVLGALPRADGSSRRARHRRRGARSAARARCAVASCSGSRTPARG